MLTRLKLHNVAEIVRERASGRASGRIDYFSQSKTYSLYDFRTMCHFSYIQ